MDAGYIDFYYHDITIKKVFEYLGISYGYLKFMDDYDLSLKKKGIHISRQKLAKFRYDFSLIKNSSLFAFIEYDGEQHFKFVEIFFKTLHEFFLRQKSDMAKTIFADVNKIPLLRIRYDQIDEKRIRYMIADLIKSPKKYVDSHNTFLSNEEYMSVFLGE